MAEPVISDLMNAVRDVIRDGMPDLANRVTYGAPEATPVTLSVWLDYSLFDYEMGLLDVATHQAIATVATPRKGAYPNEYALVTDTQQRVRQAVRNQVTYGEATLVAIESQPAIGSGYAGVPDALVAGRLIFTLETKTQILNTP